MRKALIELIVYIADITKTMKWTSAYYDFCQFIDDAAPTKPKHLNCTLNSVIRKNRQITLKAV